MYTIFGNGGDWFTKLFADINEEMDVFIAKDAFSPFLKKGILDFLCRVCFSKRFNNVIKLPFKSIWYGRLLPSPVFKTNDERQVFIFIRGNAFTYDFNFLKRIRKVYKNAVLVYWFLDIVDAVKFQTPDIIEICKEYFDYTITYNPSDAQKYGFTYIETPYSKIETSNKKQYKESDVVYVGAAKLRQDPERFEKLIAVYEKLKSQGLKLEFYINNVPQDKQLYADDITYNKWLSYEDLIGKTINSKCILEVTQKGETGTTLRMFEAIVYNKKILMTNHHLETHELYDSRYMKIFDNPDDIDVNFITDTTDVYYNTADKLSPRLFIDRVKHMIENEMRNSVRYVD